VPRNTGAIRVSYHVSSLKLNCDAEELTAQKTGGL
jgi:hypothetical protein